MPSPKLGGVPRAPGREDPVWGGWVDTVHGIAQDVSNSGTTAQRPTANQYIGKPYFDTTLGKPIWLSAMGSPPTWVDATGAVV